MNIDQIKNKISPILKASGVKRASVFGSVARGDYNENSDVDLLVEFEVIPKDLIEYLRLKNNLSDVLGKEVDLVREGYVSQYIEPYIRNELKLIYEK